MNKVLSIFLLLSASSAGASVQSFEPDETSIRPVSMAEKQRVADPALRHSCDKPILLLMKVPDGLIILLGVFPSKRRC